MAAASTKGLLKDLADELQCAICDDHLKQPKYLNCLHTFCSECLGDLAKSMNNRCLPCPLCRQKTPYPRDGIRGLKSNFMAVNLLDKITSQAVTDGGKSSTTCTSHPGEILGYYCRTCGFSVCRECCILDHCRPEHDVCKMQDVSETKKRDLKKVVEEAERKLVSSLIKIQNHKVVKTQLQSAIAQARTDLNARAEAIIRSVTEKCDEISNALTEVEEKRAALIQKNTDQNQARVQRAEKAITEAKRLLNESDVKILDEAEAKADQLKLILREDEPQDVDSALGFLEFVKKPEVIVSVSSLTIAEVYDDLKWVPYARTQGNLNLERARCVTVFHNGDIVVADNPRDYEGGVYVIDWEALERYCLVDAQQRYLSYGQKSKAVTKEIYVPGEKRDIIALPVCHNNVGCDGCGMLPLCGPHYKCLKCHDDYDLCRACFNSGIHEQHSFRSFDEHLKEHGSKVAVVSDENEIHVYDSEMGGYKQAINPPKIKQYAANHALWSIANDQCGTIFVGNTVTNKILRFDPASKNFGPIEFVFVQAFNVELKPWFIAANKTNRQILMSNLNARRVDAVSYEGEALFSITSRGPGQQLYPSGVCFHGNDTIYVVHKEAKQGKSEVHGYRSMNGSHVGVAVTGLMNPHGICIGDNDKMVVADWNDVKIFQRRPVKAKAK